MDPINDERMAPKSGSPGLSQKEPERPRRKASEPPPDRGIIRKGAWILGALVLLSPLEYRGGQALWRGLRRHRAQREAASVMKLVEAQKYAEAQRAVRTAILMDPDDPQVLRTTAQWCTLTSRAEGFNYWERLFARTPPTRQDRLDQLDLALTLRRLDLSKTLLKDLVLTYPKDREVTLRVLRHHQLMRNNANALAAARIAVVSFPNDEQIQLILGGLLLSQSNRADWADGRRLLWNVALGSSAWHDEAVDRLVLSDSLDRNDRELLVHTLEKREPRELNDQLKALKLRFDLSQTRQQREDLWPRSAELARQFPGVTNQLAMAWWYCGQGETNRALSVLPREAIGTNKFAAFGTVEVLLRCHAWDEVRQVLDQEPLALHPAQKESALGALAGGTEKAAAAAAHFAKAQAHASSAPGLLLQIAAQAERAGQPRAAVEALTRVAELNQTLTLQCSQRALELVLPLDDLKYSQRVVRRLTEFLPEDVSLALESAWLDLLCSVRIQPATEVLLGLQSQTQLGEQVRFALALAELRQGKAAAALNRLESDSFDPEKLSSRLQAVYVAVLFANDQREVAMRWVAKIPAGSLRIQERELFEKSL